MGSWMPDKSEEKGDTQAEVQPIYPGGGSSVRLSWGDAVVLYALHIAVMNLGVTR